MTDIFTLLSFTKASNALTVFAVSGNNFAEPGSASPPRKIARLDADSDTASAYRSRLTTATSLSDDAHLTTLHVIGTPIKTSPEGSGDTDVYLLKRSIRILLEKDTRESLPATYEQIYRACRSVVRSSHRGEDLYQNVKMELEKCVGSLSKSLIQDDQEATEWLVTFTEICVWFARQSDLLRSLLAYLDAVHVPNLREYSGIRELAYQLFTERVFENATLLQRLHAGIESWVKWERQEGSKHRLRPHIPSLIRQLSNYGQYVPIVETFYINYTHSFYAAESSERAEALKVDAQKYLDYCRQRRAEEQQRARDVLPESSWEEVSMTTDKALLMGRLDWLARDALRPLLDARKDQGIGMMYQLFARVNGLKVLCAAFKLHVQNIVRSIVIDVERDEEMVPRLLEFKVFADLLVASAFADEVVDASPEAPKTAASASQAGPSSMSMASEPKTKILNKDFGYAVIDAFQYGFRFRRNKPAEMIAKYLDKAMRKGQKGKKDEDFQAELDAVLGLYRFTDDKDVFRTFYHRALAKRLLLERSASDDFEKAMLKRLKEQYDPEFGMGDHMFNDLALSRDLLQEYTEHRERRGEEASAQKLSVLVLQRSFWPFAARTQDVDLPPSMQEDLAKYVVFYKTKHSGRKLDWDHSLGAATLKARFKNGEKELSVSLYQAVILLLFNEAAQLSFKEIKAQTQMEDAELRRTLQSLALGKKRVLKKSPPSKDVGDDDIFHFNADFIDPRYQVHVNSIQAKETPEESKRTQTAIEGDRKHALDAAIVRVMKARKELHYEQLKTETINAVKNHFVPDVSVIKKRIQGLVEQDYLRRDENDMNKYIYVA